jgi:hypothetical protein
MENNGKDCACKDDDESDDMHFLSNCYHFVIRHIQSFIILISPDVQIQLWLPAGAVGAPQPA